jgi:hypothetical protein
MADLAVVVDRMVVAVLMAEEAPTVAAVSRAAAHAAAELPMTVGTSTSKVGNALTVAPLAEVSAEETPTAAIILRVAETSPPNAVEALTAEVTQAVEE